MWPVDGVVGENGAFSFRYDDEVKKMRRVYAQPSDKHQQRMSRKSCRRFCAAYPGTAIASDQAYREIDVAIDFWGRAATAALRGKKSGRLSLQKVQPQRLVQFM